MTAQATAPSRNPDDWSPHRSDRGPIDFPEATITDITVDVVSGDSHPVAWIEVAAVYLYRQGSAVTSYALTDQDGRAVFRDVHSQDPSSVCLVVANQVSDPYGVSPHMAVVLEL